MPLRIPRGVKGGYPGGPSPPDSAGGTPVAAGFDRAIGAVVLPPRLVALPSPTSSSGATLPCRASCRRSPPAQSFLDDTAHRLDEPQSHTGGLGPGGSAPPTTLCRRWAPSARSSAAAGGHAVDHGTRCVLARTPPALREVEYGVLSLPQMAARGALATAPGCPGC